MFEKPENLTRIIFVTYRSLNFERNNFTRQRIYQKYEASRTLKIKTSKYPIEVNSFLMFAKCVFDSISKKSCLNQRDVGLAGNMKKYDGMSAWSLSGFVYSLFFLYFIPIISYARMHKRQASTTIETSWGYARL